LTVAIVGRTFAGCCASSTAPICSRPGTIRMSGGAPGVAGERGHLRSLPRGLSVRAKMARAFLLSPPRKNLRLCASCLACGEGSGFALRADPG
jgi:hypothetical protein